MLQSLRDKDAGEQPFSRNFGESNLLDALALLRSNTVFWAFASCLLEYLGPWSPCQPTPAKKASKA